MDQQTQRLLEVLDRHGRELHRLLVRLTLREDVAEDLLQDLFIKLRKSAGFRDSHSPAAYARRAAVHLAFDWRRGKHERLAKQNTRVDYPPATGLDPAEAINVKDQVRQTLELLDQLAPIYRDCLLMRYLQQEEYATIAEQLDKSEHQVRALCSKAIQQLRNLLQPETDRPAR